MGVSVTSATDDEIGGYVASRPAQVPLTQPSNIRITGIEESELPKSRKANDHGFTDYLKATGEVVATIGSGAFAEPAAGLAGLQAGIKAYLSGDGDYLSAASRRIEEVRNEFTYSPRTDAAKSGLKVIAKPFELLHKGAVKAGEATLDATGSPGAATAVQSSIELSPALVGLKGKSGALKSKIKKIEGDAADMGIDIGAPAGTKVGQIQAAAEEITGGMKSKGDAMLDLQNQIKTARQVAKENTDNLYAEARATNASVASRDLASLPDTVKASLESFDIDLMPIVQKRIKELDVIKDFPANSSVKLDAISKYRARLTNNRPAKTDLSQNYALDIIKGQLDKHIDDLFNSDMISGDPSAVVKWQNAREAYALYKKNFTANKVINDFAKKEVTPEELRRWIFGSSKTGAKTEAATVVNGIKNIVGEDSPQFQALRQDFMLTVLEPLLVDAPTTKNLHAFVKNYNDLVKNNKSIIDAIDPKAKVQLDSLAKIALSTEHISPKVFIKLERSAAVLMFGHGIAKRALTVRLAEKAFDLLKGIKDASRRKRAMADMLGYDAVAPTLKISAFGVPAAGQTAIHQEQ